MSSALQEDSLLLEPPDYGWAHLKNHHWGFPSGSDSKELPEMQEIQVRFLGWEDPLEKGKATHSSILAWEILWTEEPGGLQPMGSQRVGHDSETITLSNMCIALSAFCLPLYGISFSIPSL